MIYAVGESVLTKEEQLYEELSSGIIKFHFSEGSLVVDFFNDELLTILEVTKEEFEKADLENLSSFITEETLDDIKKLMLGSGEDLGTLSFTVYHRSGTQKELSCRFHHKKDVNGVEAYYVVTTQLDLAQELRQEKIDNLWHNTLINYTFDNMMKAKDISAAIHLLLIELCHSYDVNLVSIVGFGDDHKMRAEYTAVRHLPEEDIRLFEKMELSMLHSMYEYADHNGIVAVEDIAELRSGSPICALAKLTGAKSILQCTMFDNGRYKGCIYLEDRKKYHEWTNQQIQTLLSITKIMTFYLSRIKISENIKLQLENMQNYDALTGVPTMLLFKKRIVEIRKQFPTKRYVLLYQDFYNFKSINETLGYEFGDHILKDWGFRLCGFCEGEFMVARVTSDIFIGMVPFYSNERLESKIAQLGREFYCQQKKKNINCNVHICVGAYVLEPEDKDIVAAIDNANFARKILKTKAGNGQLLFYNQEMKEKIQKEIDIANSMKEALENHEFIVYLQPKVDLITNTVAGAEALVRWQKPDGVMLYPDEFISIFERNGFIIDLDYYVYQRTCEMIKSWIDQGITPVPISVNVSRIHLYDDGFVTYVNQLVEGYNIPKKFIEFELTESVFIDNSADAIGIMDRLRLLGYKISIDDFGAGYSSLSLLKDMPTDVLKLDKAFFREGELKREDKIIVSSIINMAKQLDMTVLSEGVENIDQSDFLKDISCDLAQGYLFAKPMPMDEFNVRYMKS